MSVRFVVVSLYCLFSSKEAVFHDGVLSKDHMHYIKVNHLHHVSKEVWLMSHNSNILVERHGHHLLRPFSRIVVLDALALAHYAALDRVHKRYIVARHQRIFSTKALLLYYSCCK